MAAMKSLNLSYLLQYLKRLDFFTKAYAFCIKEYNKTHDNYIRHYIFPHISLDIWDKDFIFSSNHSFRYQGIEPTMEHVQT